MKTDIHQNKRFLFQIYRFGECDSKRWHFERKKLAKLILKLIKRKLSTIKINDSSKNANWNNDERKVVRFDSVPVPVLVFLSSDLIYCVLFDYFLHIYTFLLFVVFPNFVIESAYISWPFFFFNLAIVFKHADQATYWLLLLVLPNAMNSRNHDIFSFFVACFFF